MEKSQDSAETTAEETLLRPIDVVHRLQKEKRWKELEPIKNDLIKDARKQGMKRDDAQRFAYGELHRLYPPLPEPEPEDEPEDEEPDEPEETDEDSSGDVTEPKPDDVTPPAADNNLHAHASGVGQIPETWPQLPGNASLQAEIAWVQSERLRVVDESATVAKVDLALASTPAPSMAALGWLETSIRSYAKYVDVVARVMSTQVDEQQHVHRERMAIEDIRGLLREMRTS